MTNKLAIGLALAAILLAESVSAEYSTSFNANENPISEGGAWQHSGLDWTKVQTSGGNAYGTQTGFGNTDDSYAYLTAPFLPNQRGEGTVYKSASGNFTCSKEAELLLRWADSAHNARGYEVLFSASASTVQIVRWNGAFNSYTVLGTAGQIPIPDGTIARAEAVGSVITAYVNGVPKLVVTDSSYATGQPGIGLFRRECGGAQDVGWRDYTATSLPEPCPLASIVLVPFLLLLRRSRLTLAVSMCVLLAGAFPANAFHIQDGSGAAPTGYRVYYGAASQAYTATIDVGLPPIDATGARPASLTGVAPGAYYVTAAGYNAAGEGLKGNEIQVVVQAVPSPPPPSAPAVTNLALWSGTGTTYTTNIADSDLVDGDAIQSTVASCRGVEARGNSIIRSVRLSIDGGVANCESSAPYSLGYDDGTHPGCVPKLAVVGSHTIAAVPFGASGCTGVQGPAKTTTVTVAPAPTPITADTSLRWVPISAADTTSLCTAGGCKARLSFTPGTGPISARTITVRDRNGLSFTWAMSDLTVGTWNLSIPTNFVAPITFTTLVVSNDGQSKPSNASPIAAPIWVTP